MELTGVKSIPASQKEVWDALHDVERLQHCIPGCESLEWTSNTDIEGRIKTKIGPVKASFNVKMNVSNAVPTESFTLSGQASSGAHGFASGSANITLKEVAEGCQLNYVTTTKIGGKIAQLGSRLMKGTSDKFTNQFFEEFVKSFDTAKDQ